VTAQGWPRARFVVNGAHLRLLPRLKFEYGDWLEFGAPCVDPKRPYGNSDVYGDLRGILGERPDEELLRLHREMTTVLQILLRNGSVAAGEYNARQYFADWTRS
jgi:hypothetical protein